MYGEILYLIKNVVVPISKEIELKKALSNKLRTKSIENFKIIRRSIDARKKNNLKFNYTILAELPSKTLKHPDVLEYQNPKPYIQTQRKLSSENPFIIGAGPAGLFAALSLVEKGFSPYIFDRGDKLEMRINKVNDFWKKGILDEESNVQFGEGGAGTFSDGKLTTRTHDFYTEKVINWLIQFGADKKISYEALPHLGTDGLRKIIQNIRIYLENKGCKFFWNHKLQDINLNNDKINSVQISNQTFQPEILILAIGNAARDTFEMLSEKINLESKSFSVGVRIEHPRKFIDQAFYGEKTDFSLTGPATYRLTAKYKNKGIYSFCMCPGGFIIAGASEKNLQVLNGMSYLHRNNNFSNSAIVVNVNKIDFGNKILSGIEFQRNMEKKCFKKNKQYFAPAQFAKDFLENEISSSDLHTSYNPGIFKANLNNLLPLQINEALKYGLKIFEKRIPGFVKKGILLAPETRTSSPIRILRNKEVFASLTLPDLYPVGEGSGYSGGIISSAADGYKLGKIFYC